MIEERIIDNIQQMAIKQSQQVDSYIKEVNQIAKNFIVNKDIQDTLNKVNLSKGRIDESSMLNYNRKFDDIMNRMIPVTSIPLSHIYVYDNSNRFKYSYNPIESNFELIRNDVDIINRLKDRQMVLLSNNMNNDTQTNSNSFSIVRSVFDVDSKMYGYVEVQQNYKELEKICEIGSVGTIFIVDSDGLFLYPKNKVLDDDKQFITATEIVSDSGILQDSAGSIYSYSKSTHFDLTVYIKHSRENVLYPLHLVRNITGVVIIGITIFTLLMIYFISRLLVNPIRKLKDDMMNIGFNKIEADTGNSIYNDEVYQLNLAFQDMIDRLRKSMEREVASSKEEAKARFAALQAQIAPHFVHNVLYLISISAQENNPLGVVSMCKALSNMLRYVVHSPFSNVTMEDEIGYTQNYLLLQAKNYEDFLVYEIDVQDSAKTIPLPRLVVQPFVENAIIHGFKNMEPPWIVNIRANVNDECWAILIEDNGCGISKDKLDQLNSKMDINISDRTIDNFKIDGMGNMGVLNTVLRLKLMYGDNLKFSAFTNFYGGTTICITGPLKPAHFEM